MITKEEILDKAGEFMYNPDEIDAFIKGTGWAIEEMEKRTPSVNPNPFRFGVPHITSNELTKLEQFTLKAMEAMIIGRSFPLSECARRAVSLASETLKELEKLKELAKTK